MPTGAQIVDQARQAAAAGSPYVYGGNPYAGYSWAQFRSDCSGLVDRIFANLGTPFQGRPVTTDLVKMGTAVNGLANALPGDLLFFNGSSHVGIYVGNGQMIDDPQTGQNVKQEAVYATPNAIRRVSTGNTSSAAGTGTVLGAIEAATNDANTRLALSLGALLEGGSLGAGPFPTGDHGESPGPFQIRLYDDTGAPVHGNQITRAQAQNPTTAVGFMLSTYQAAVAKVGAAAFKANPEKAAEQAAFLAESPAQDYYTSRGSSTVASLYQQATAALSGAPAGTAAAGTGTAQNAAFLGVPSPSDIGGAVASGAETVIKDITSPIATFLENSFLVSMGVLAVIIGIILIATDNSSGGNPTEDEEQSPRGEAAAAALA